MSTLVNKFNEYRKELNKVILAKNNLVMKRLREGALDKNKRNAGLVASMVLRCDDCINIDPGKPDEPGITTEQVYEIFAVANIAGGTIVIPYTRRAAEYWEALHST